MPMRCWLLLASAAVMPLLVGSCSGGTGCPDDTDEQPDRWIPLTQTTAELSSGGRTCILAIDGTLTTPWGGIDASLTWSGQDQRDLRIPEDERLVEIELVLVDTESEAIVRRSTIPDGLLDKLAEREEVVWSNVFGNSGRLEDREKLADGAEEDPLPLGEYDLDVAYRYQGAPRVQERVGGVKVTYFK